MARAARPSEPTLAYARAAGHGGDAESRRWGLRGCAPGDTRAKIPFVLPSMLPRLSSPFPHFFPSLASFLEELGHIVLISLHTCLLVLRRTGMAMRVSPSQSRNDPYHHPWLNPAAPGHMTSMRLVASCGVEIHRLQRPSLRAGSHPHHPMLSASGDASWKACGRRPHLSDGVLCRPGNSTGRLHQHPDRGMTPPQPST